MKWCQGKTLRALLLIGVFSFFCATQTEAKTYDTVKDGVYAGEISLGGKTKEVAEKEIREYVTSLSEKKITLLIHGDQKVELSIGEIGISWKNPELVENALSLGSKGNIVQRYKAMMDLCQNNQVYPIELEFDKAAIDAFLKETCDNTDQPPKDGYLVRENNAFTIVEGVPGYELDIEASVELIYQYVCTDWNRSEDSLQLVVREIPPRGSREELVKVQDLLGGFTTSFASSGKSRSANIANGAKLINGTTLYPGDEFSTCEEVSPFTDKIGYTMAGSYLSGLVVDSLGGGICQVSTTLYNAVLLSELEVTKRYNHSMVISYTDLSRDAAIAEDAGKDLRFVNNTAFPIYIESYTTDAKAITVNIYGVEERAPERTIEFVSEKVEVISPKGETVTADYKEPLGYIKVSSAYTGYKAKLWKVIYENGVEVDRVVVNTSSYKMVPTNAMVGVVTDNQYAYNEIMAAISTGSIEHVKNVIALLTGQ